MKCAYEQDCEQLTTEKLLATPLVWTATPEDFLEFVYVSTYAANPNKLPLTSAEKAMGLKAATMENMAHAFMEVIEINLAPYKDFTDLQKHTGYTSDTSKHTPPFSLKATNVTHCDATTRMVLMPESLHAEEALLKWADAFISKTAKYIRFDNINFSKLVLAMKLAF